LRFKNDVRARSLLDTNQPVLCLPRSDTEFASFSPGSASGLQASGSALVSPFERMFGWFGERLVHSGGGFDRAEGLFGRVLRAAAAPFRLLAACCCPNGCETCGMRQARPRCESSREWPTR
jgi:hypothetical protein